MKYILIKNADSFFFPRVFGRAVKIECYSLDATCIRSMANTKWGRDRERKKSGE